MTAYWVKKATVGKVLEIDIYKIRWKTLDFQIGLLFCFHCYATSDPSDRRDVFCCLPSTVVRKKECICGQEERMYINISYIFTKERDSVQSLCTERQHLRNVGASCVIEGTLDNKIFMINLLWKGLSSWI